MKVPITATVAVLVGLVLSAVPGAAATSATPATAPESRSLAGQPATAAGFGAPPAAPTIQKHSPSSAMVTLVTGDRVRLDTLQDGTQKTVPLPTASGPGAKVSTAPMVQFTFGGDQYAVPVAAVPYLSSTLDSRLFDVSYLVRAGLDDAHSTTLPVTVKGRNGAQAPALPGLVVTARSAGVADARISKAQASRFGAHLARQWQDNRARRSSVPAGALSGVSTISLDAPAGSGTTAVAPAPSATPKAQGSGLRFRTLTLNFVDANGAPAAAAGVVQNVEDARAGYSFLEFASDFSPGGPISVSVPEGTYSLAFSVITPHTSDPSFDVALVAKPEITIRGDQTVTFDARTAVPYRASLDPPVTAEQRIDTVQFVRTSVAGGGFSTMEGGGFNVASMALASGLGLLVGTQLSVTPTPTVTKGTFGFVAATILIGTTQPSAAPRHYLTFPTEGRVPSSLTYTVPAADLTTVHQSVYRGATETTCSPLDQLKLYPTMYTRWGDSLQLFRFFWDVLPGDRTDYWYSSAPELGVWENTFLADDCTYRFGTRRVISHGQDLTEVWNKAPVTRSGGLTPDEMVLGHPLRDATATICTACRQDDNGVLDMGSFGDSDPSHRAWLDWEQPSSLTFHIGDKLLFRSEPEQAGGLPPVWPSGLYLPMAHRPETYRLDWTTGSRHDPVARTVSNWTFHSSPTDPAASLPASERCLPDPGQRCSLLPLLFVRYDLALNFDSRARAGAPFQLDFTVAGQLNAPAPDGVTATVEVSYDDGRTWTSLDTEPAGGGRFTADLTHPDLASTTGYVSLRVQGQDAAGNSVTQTTIRAYGLTN